ERGPLYAEQALAALHQGNPRRLPLSLEIARHGDAVTLFCRFPEELRSLIEGQVYAQYPECRLEHLPESALDPPPGHRVWSVDLYLHPEIFPIRRYSQLEDALNRNTADPLTALLSTVARGKGHSLRARIQITLHPASGRRRRRAARCL